MSREQQKANQKGPSSLYEEVAIPSTNENEGVKKTIARIEDTLGHTMRESDVMVISGANSQPFPLATQTVADARAILQQVMNIGPNSVALVNGQEVSPDFVLGEGQTLEFVKEGGEKGARRVQH